MNALFRCVLLTALSMGFVVSLCADVSAQTTQNVAPTSKKATSQPGAKETPTSRKKPVAKEKPVVRVEPVVRSNPVVRTRPVVRVKPVPSKVPVKRALSKRLKPVLPKATKGWWHNSYLLDWGIALALAGGGAALNFVQPPNRPFRSDDPTIGLPMHDDFVSEPLLIGLALGVPLATFALAQIGLRSGHDFHHATLGLVESFGLTLFFTVMLKVTVGRLRPDFLERCQPNASLACTGDASIVEKGRRSFPSGHSSFAMVGGVYLSLYLWGKLQPFRGPGSFWKVPVILLPIAGASLVAVSRIVDNRHHWEDVLVGSLLGAGFAILGYHLNFPAPWSDNAGKPYSRSRISVLPVVTPEQVGMSFAGKF